MKVGDLVIRKDAGYKPDYGFGIVTSYDGYGKFRVMWQKLDKPISHDLYELVRHESR